MDDVNRTAKDFLEQFVDMRFRLNTSWGIISTYRDPGDDDPYADADQDDLVEDEEADEGNGEHNRQAIETFVKRIWALAQNVAAKSRAPLAI